MVSAAIPWDAAAKMLGQQTARIAQGMPRAAQNVGQGIGAGVSYVAGSELVAQPVKGIKGLLLNIIPENMVGWYVLLIMLVYYWSWMAGFAAPVVLQSHAIMAVIGFFLFVYVESSLEEGKGSLWQIIRRNGVTFSVLMIIDNMLLTGQFQWNLILIAALLMAFREGHPLDDLKRVVTIMLVASAVTAVGPFLYNQFNQFFFSAAAKIALPLNFEFGALNFSYLPFILALLANRTFTYPFFWFAIFWLSKKTRVARSLAWIVTFLFIFASWPNIAPEVSKLHSQYITGATPEQKEFWPNILKQATTNARGAIISLFQSFSVGTASAYEKTYGNLEQTFGFGQPKQEPKLGLQLSQNSQMLKKFPDYEPPEPSFIMGVPNPFPADSKNPYIEVTEIKCKESSGKGLNFIKAVTDEGFTVTPANQPVEVYYSGPRGGNEVKCLFEGWQLGEDYNVGAEVTYKVENSAYLSTTFMRADKLRGLRLNPSDQKTKKVLDDIPPAAAEHRNVPVTLTWGPLVLKNAPVPIDLDRESNNLAITVYVATNPAWGSGVGKTEIKAVTQLGLLLPAGATLTVNDKSCDFIESNADSGDGRKWYVVNPKKIRKDGVGEWIFIGDAIKFDCGMTVGAAALGGKDAATARFDVSGSFEVTTKLEGITFKYGSVAPASSQPAQQQVQKSSPSQPLAPAPAPPAAPSAATT